MRVTARFLSVRSQALEQAPEERLVTRQACCPVDVGLGHKPLVPDLACLIVSLRHSALMAG
jgi:hypothetical protein